MQRSFETRLLPRREALCLCLTTPPPRRTQLDTVTKSALAELTDGSRGHHRPTGYRRPAGVLSPPGSSCHACHTRKSAHNRVPWRRFVVVSRTYLGWRATSLFLRRLQSELHRFGAYTHTHTRTFSLALHLRMCVKKRRGGQRWTPTALSARVKVRVSDVDALQKKGGEVCGGF